MKLQRDESPFAKRLKSAGLAESPPFSPQLHRQIMAKLAQNGCLTGSSDPPSLPWARPLRIAAGLAVAAAVALGAWITLNPAAPEVRPTPEIIALPPMPSDLTAPVHDILTGPTAQSLDDGKYAYLDRDAQRLVAFVAEQLPTFGEPDTK